ncbi:MAG: rhodanese-like domain-containing protein [Acidimicrobiales bacterium]
MAHDVRADELRSRLDSGEPVFVLDVREPEEVAEWPFPGAHHVPLGELGERTGELPLDAPVVVVCHLGTRSALAAEALTRAGWPAESLAGGIEAWEASAPERR